MNLPPDPKRYIDHTGSIVFVEPLSWNEIKERIETKDLNFGRSREGLREYKSFKSQICKEWFSIDSYCKHRYFNIPYTFKTGDGGAQLKFVDEDTKVPESETNPLVFCENDYPYYFDENIIHWVLWSMREPPAAEIDALVKEKFPADQFDLLIMENPNKTVKSVYHLHIFARKKLPTA